MTEILNDNQVEENFAIEIKKRREKVELVTIMTSVGFLVNVLISYMVVKLLIERISGGISYKYFFYLYSWNIAVIGVVVYILNKYKF